MLSILSIWYLKIDERLKVLISPKPLLLGVNWEILGFNRESGLILAILHKMHLCLILGLSMPWCMLWAWFWLVYSLHFPRLCDLTHCYLLIAQAICNLTPTINYWGRNTQDIYHLGRETLILNYWPKVAGF